MDTFISIAWGAVAAGKGELMRRLSGEHVIVSSSDMIREDMERMSPEERDAVEKIMGKGKLYDDGKMIQLVERRLFAIGNVPSIITDGFPRNVVQARYFIDFLVRSKRYNLGSIMLFKLDRGTARERFEGRNKKETRVDSALSVFEDRFDDHERNFHPMMKYFTEFAKVPVDIIDAEQDEAGVEAQGRNILARRLAPGVTSGMDHIWV